MKNFKATLDIILKEFQEGVDFTIESKEKIIFHSEKIFSRIMQQWVAEGFFKDLGKNENSEKEMIEEAKKNFEKMFSCPASYHEEDIGAGRKRGVFTPIKKNVEIVDGLGKPPGNDDQPASFKIKGSDGELRKVSKEEFASWMMEEKEEKNIKTPPKESLVVVASGDIDEITVFVERKGPNGVFRENYYRARSEEEKNRIIKRNKERRERENSLIVKQEPAKRAVQETDDNQEIRPITSQSSSLTSNSNHHNDSYFGTVTLLVSLLLGVGLVGYGISLVIKKKNKQSR